MSVLLELHARLAVHDLLLGLGAVIVTQLVEQVFGELAAAHVDPYLPAIVALEHLVHEVASRDLRRLFLEQLQFGTQHAAAQRIENQRVVVDPFLVRRRAVQARGVARNIDAPDVLIPVELAPELAAQGRRVVLLGLRFAQYLFEDVDPFLFVVDLRE